MPRARVEHFQGNFGQDECDGGVVGIAAKPKK
jgi:hypothetical protein